MIPVLAVAFVLLAALLLWFVIGSRGAWWLKLPVIAGTCAFTFAVWDALDSFDGWATGQALPARAVFVSGVVDEPDAIYLWLIAPTEPGVLGYRPQGAEPRAYRLPYTRPLHERVDRGNQLTRRGQRVELHALPARRNAARAVRITRLAPLSLPSKGQVPERTVGAIE